MEQQFLEIHASQVLVTRKIPYKTPIIPQLLNGYASDRDLRIQDSRMLHSREFLFMPVHMSPVLIYLINKPWHHRYTDSFSVIYQLWTIGRTYSNPQDPYYQMYKERIDAARAVMLEEMTRFDEQLIQHMRTTELSQDAFISYMQVATIDRIRILEKFIQSLFNMPFPPLQTPYEYPLVTKLSLEAQGKYEEHMAHYYDSKQVVRNDRLKNESGFEESKNYFPSLATKNYSGLMYEYYQYLKEE
jgi:hypothetical protein